MNHEISKDNRPVVSNPQYNRSSYPLDKRLIGNVPPSGTGAPLPSPEEEWHSDFTTLPVELQDNLMSTSFTSEQDWESDDAEEVPSEAVSNEVDDDDDEDDDGEDGVIGAEDDDDDEDENSSSSGEFVWQVSLINKQMFFFQKFGIFYSQFDSFYLLACFLESCSSSRALAYTHARARSLKYRQNQDSFYNK